MIEETVAKIEQAIRRAGDADPKHKEELIRLLGQLKALLGEENVRMSTSKSMEISVPQIGQSKNGRVPGAV